MRRVLAAVRCDVTVQARHGFYLVSIVLTPLLGWLLGLLPMERIDLTAVLPAAMTFSLLITTFFFVGALVLLEKTQGSLAALATSPLRPGDWLAAKVLTLSLLGLAESLIVVAIGFGPGTIGPGLVAGGGGLAVLYVLFGFVTIARYDTFEAYILPASGVATLAFLPLLGVFGLGPTLLWSLHPSFGPLVLMQEPVSSVAWIYGIGATLAWISVAALWAQRVYVRITTVSSRRFDAAAA